MISRLVELTYHLVELLVHLYLFLGIIYGVPILEIQDQYNVVANNNRYLLNR